MLKREGKEEGAKRRNDRLRENTGKRHAAEREPTDGYGEKKKGEKRTEKQAEELPSFFERKEKESTAISSTDTKSEFAVDSRQKGTSLRTLFFGEQSNSATIGTPQHEKRQGRTKRVSVQDQSLLQRVLQRLKPPTEEIRTEEKKAFLSAIFGNHPRAARAQVSLCSCECSLSVLRVTQPSH